MPSDTRSSPSILNKAWLNLYFEVFLKDAGHILGSAMFELRYNETADQSKVILHAPNPKIVIAGSGMSNGGRILHHELNYLGDPTNTLLLVGYQSVGTLL